jgi:hypothetical protein
MIGTSLVLPVVYGIWTVVRGVVANWYPYPFVDMRSLGYQRGLLNMASFLVVFVIVALTLVVVDRTMGSVRQPRR